MREVYWRIQFLQLTSMQRNIFCSGAPCSSGSSSGMEYLDTWHVKINFWFERQHARTLTIICSRLSSLVLYMMGKARPQESREMPRKTIRAPRLLIWSRLLSSVQTRRLLPTCMDWDLTMNLYLSTAMAMLVSEDMYTVTHGKVFTNLGSSGLVEGVAVC